MYVTLLILDMLSLAVGQCRATNDSFVITSLILLQPKDTRNEIDVLVNYSVSEEILLCSLNTKLIV